MPDAAHTPASGQTADTREAAWFAQLSTVVLAAAALFTDQAGRVLLVKPNYRDHWSLAGGILEHGGAPGARRGGLR